MRDMKVLRRLVIFRGGPSNDLSQQDQQLVPVIGGLKSVVVNMDCSNATMSCVFQNESVTSLRLLGMDRGSAQRKALPISTNLCRRLEYLGLDFMIPHNMQPLSQFECLRELLVDRIDDTSFSLAGVSRLRALRRLALNFKFEQVPSPSDASAEELLSCASLVSFAIEAVREASKGFHFRAKDKTNPAPHRGAALRSMVLPRM
jgi:hypothetical protein